MVLEKIRRVKAAKNLYKTGDERLVEYEERPLLKMLADRLYHSPEISETDLEDATKSVIAVYDYSWRSAEVNILNFD